MDDSVLKTKMDIFGKKLQKLPLAKALCLPSVGAMVLGVACLLLPSMSPGIMAQSTGGKGPVSQIYSIDDGTIGEWGTAKPFYIQTQVDPQCPVYICYLSQLDERYQPSDNLRQIRAGLTVRNLKNNEITDQCNPKNHGKLANAPQPNAWHGMKVDFDTQSEKDKTVERLVRIQTSFSEEQIYLRHDKLTMPNIAGEPKSIRIHFGSFKHPLFTEYQNTDNETLSYVPLDKLKMSEWRRIPPSKALHGATNIRDSFQGNPGAWLIPMDMAQLERYDGNGPTRMVFFVADCTKEKMPTITIMMDKETRVDMDIGTKTKGVRMRTTTIGKPNINTETVENTMPKTDCRTQYVNAKAAVIRDRFADLQLACPDLPRSEKCEVRIDYAVRLGCINCKQGITTNEQNHFLEVLRDWMKELIENAKHDESLYPYDDLEEWKGTKLVDFLNSPNKPQTINKLEPGGFRYVTVPKEWAENKKGLYMLITDCEGLGQFASAFRRGKVDPSPQLEENCNWEKKFEFLEECDFEQNVFVKRSYKVRDALGFANLAIEIPLNQIYFGIYKLDARLRLKESYTLTAEQIQAHKFKYGLSDPIREHEFVGDSVDKYWRVKRWGRYIEQPDLMYQPYNHTPHIYEIALKKYKKEDLPRGKMMTDEEFINANVDVTVSQMDMKCGDIYYMSTRVNAIQRFDYKVQGKHVETKPELYLQTYYYELDYLHGQPGKDNGQDCFTDEQCLADVHIYKYKRSIGK